jgi:phage FluMu gp28-like protein
MDEGGQIKEEAWTLALRPALMDKKGIAFFTGTPKGKNWYFQLWTRGQDTEQTDYESWAFPSVNNPYIDPAEIEDFARDMPEQAYKQEILAEFVDDVGTVFRRVDSCIAGSYEPYQPRHTYYMGVDLAKHMDFTVICVLNEEAQLVYFDRFKELDWVFQSKRIFNIAQRYHAQVLVDSTGVGEPIYDQLSRMGLRVNGYRFTNQSKKDLIENLSIQIENGHVRYPAEPVLLNELKMFGYTVSQTGIIRYGAPEGYHDDCVISLALAVWPVSRPRGYILM